MGGVTEPPAPPPAADASVGTARQAEHPEEGDQGHRDDHSAHALLSPKHANPGHSHRNTPLIVLVKVTLFQNGMLIDMFWLQLTVTGWPIVEPEHAMFSVGEPVM